MKILKKEQKGVKKDLTMLNRTFRYTNGMVNLNFSLSIDNDKELKEFLEILKVALVDVEEQIVKINDK